MKPVTVDFRGGFGISLYLMQEKTSLQRQSFLGTWFAVLAFGSWGFLPVYWKLLQTISPYEIVAHRVLHSFLFCTCLLLLRKRLKSIGAILKNSSKMKGVIICGFLLSLNWLTFIYAVNSNQVLEASMGYYINPLISVFLGLLVLKEKVNSWQKVSIALAFIAVFMVTFRYGKIPWIALTLAVTFGLYGLVKKTGGVEPVTGLALETLIVLPISLGFIGITALHGTSAVVMGTATYNSGTALLMLMSTGVITAVPLLLFAGAAQRIPLSRVGFIQYLTPSMFFLLGRFLYAEPFTTTQLISFILIWFALALFSFSPRERHRQPRTRSQA